MVSNKSWRTELLHAVVLLSSDLTYARYFCESSINYGNTSFGRWAQGFGPRLLS